MAKDNNISTFTALDIEKYHKGLLSAAERHQMEKAALEDPFLADALEGYAYAGSQVTTDLSDLTARINKAAQVGKVVSMQPVKKTFSPLLRAAAMVVIIAGAGLGVYQFAFNKKDKEVAQAKPVVKKEEPAVSLPADSIPVTLTDKDEKKTNPQLPVRTEQPDAGATRSTPEHVVNQPANTQQAPGKSDIDTKGTDINAETIVNSDTRSASGGNLKPAPAPVKAIPADLEESKSKAKESELAREESKSRPVAVKKQESANIDNFKKQQNRVASNDKNPKEDIRQQNQDDYYKNQSMNTFRGRVTDPNNVGLPFANVTNLRDNVGTYTDANGNFILTSTDTVMNVQIRSMGYDNNNIQLRRDLTANQITLQEDRNSLSEQVTVSAKPNTAARSKDGNRKLIEPEPLDGWVKYDSYLANNLNIPEEYKQQNNNNANSVELSFEVDKNGEPVNIKVEKSLCSSCDKEAIRLVKDGPKWKRNAAKKGRTRVTINF